MARDRTERHYRRGPARTVWPAPGFPATRRAARRAGDDYGRPAEPGWRGVDWPAHTRRVALAEAEVNVVELGAGDHAVVFVHGLGGCWQNWLENLPATAAAGHRVIALDLPGFGASPLPDGEISIERYAGTVDQLAEALGLGTVTVVGNSMGGFVAAEVALRHPQRAERVVLVDAAGISSHFGEQRGSGVRKLLVRGAIGGLTPRDPQLAMRLMRRPGMVHAAMSAVARHPTRLSKELIAEQLPSLGAPGFRAAMDAVFGVGLTDRLGDLAQPALIVQGDCDVLVPLGDAHEFAARLPDATLLILEDTGHVPMLERPDAFNRALLDFIAGRGDLAPGGPEVVGVAAGG
jgi:pimeloyl-ACP methyl ester carboxylesterase